MAETIDRLRNLIEDRLAELDAEAKSLNGALAGIGPGPSRPIPPTGQPAPAKPRRKSPVKPASSGQRQRELLAAITANPDSSAAELAVLLDVKGAQIYSLLSRARAEKQIVKYGTGYRLRAPSGRAS